MRNQAQLNVNVDPVHRRPLLCSKLPCVRLSGMTSVRYDALGEVEGKRGARWPSWVREEGVHEGGGRRGMTWFKEEGASRRAARFPNSCRTQGEEVGLPNCGTAHFGALPFGV